MRPARAAAENKNTTRSSSAPKKKLSGASLFLAEMVRRRMVSQRMERGDTGLHRGLEHERERNQERPSAACSPLQAAAAGSQMRSVTRRTPSW